MTLVPLQLYFTRAAGPRSSSASRAGKKLHDKRAAIKDRDWQREKQRIMRDAGREHRPGLSRR